MRGKALKGNVKKNLTGMFNAHVRLRIYSKTVCTKVAIWQPTNECIAHENSSLFIHLND